VLVLGVFGGVGDVAFGGHRAIIGGSRWVVLVVVRLAFASKGGWDKRWLACHGRRVS
jgi:hypothetical protein